MLRPELNTTANWEVREIPAWISVSPTKGSGTKRLEVRVKENKTIFERSAPVTIVNTDTGAEIVLELKQNKNPKYEGLSGYSWLGYGYYLPKEYASSSSVRSEVLDIHKLLAKDIFIKVDLSNEASTKNVVGESFDHFTEEICNTFSITGGYDGGSPLKKVADADNSVKKDPTGVKNSVKASIKQVFGNRLSSITTHKYALRRDIIRKSTIELTNTLTIDELRSVLTEEADKNINGNLSPEKVIQMYGTHLIIGFTMGGTFDYWMSVKESSVSSTQEWKNVVNVAANYKQGSGEVSNEFRKYKELQSGENTLYEYLSARGGASQYVVVNKDGKQEAFTNWLTSLDKNDNWVMIDFANAGIVPLWELPTQPQRRKQLEDAIKKEIEKEALSYKTGTIQIGRCYKIVSRNDKGNTLHLSVVDNKQEGQGREEVKLLDFSGNLNFKNGKYAFNKTVNINLDMNTDHELIFEASAINPGAAFIPSAHSAGKAILKYDAKSQQWTLDGKAYKLGSQFILVCKDGTDVHNKIELTFTVQ